MSGQKRFLTIPEMTEEEIARFKSNYIEAGSDECWLWTGGRHSKGYGHFSMRGKSFRASRVALALAGKRDDTLYALHNPIKCNHRNCVNPAHLRFGTIAENNRDIIIAGNGGNMRGDRHGRAKLRSDYIPIIRKLSEHLYWREIADLYGVAISTIGSILIGKSWKHVI